MYEFKNDKDCVIIESGRFSVSEASRRNSKYLNLAQNKNFN